MRIAREQAVGIVVGALVLMLVVAGPAAAAFPLLEPPYQLDGPIGPTLAVLDYDADGFLDIAGLGHDGTLTLRRGTSTGFTVAQTVGVPGGGYARALVAADLDGDGRDDLLAAYGQSATVVLIRGRADGALASPAANDIHSFGTATTSNLTPVSIDTADLDGDADLDVAAAMGVDEDGHTPANTLENGHVTVFVNDGHGGLVASATTLAVNAPADLLLLRLAGDADPDLIVAQRNRDAASTVKIFAGAADASFGAAAYAPAGAQATELDAGNFDDDGRVDVVVAHGNVGSNAPQPGSILPGAAAAALGPPITVAAADGDHIVAGDLDRDGRDDLYVADGRSAFPFLDAPDDPIFVRGLGDLRFAPRDRGPYDALPRFEKSPQLGDIDADGKLDVVTSGWNGNVPPDHVFIRFGLGPQLVPTSANVDFGSAAIGTRASARMISFENIGPGTAASLGRKDGGDIGDFPVTRDTCTGATLAIGETCTLEVAFAPTTLGERIADAATFAPDSEYIYPAVLIGTGVPVSAPPSSAGIPPAEAPPAAPPAVAERVKRLKPTITRTTRRGLLRRGLRFTQRFPSAGIVRWTLKLRATRSKAATVVARARRTLTRGGTIRMTIVLSRRGRRHVSRSRASSVVLHTSYLPTSATRRSDTTVVQLRR